MSSEKNVPTLLGGAFLLVIVTSAVGGMSSNSAVGSGSISDILVNTSNSVTLMRISMLADMLNTLGIVVLAVLLYTVLNKQTPRHICLWYPGRFRGISWDRARILWL